jgi:predicted porin
VRNSNRTKALVQGRGTSRSKLWSLSGVAAALVSVTGLAQAQTTSATSPPAPADQSLTWHGITLYGIVDVGVQYESHGAPFNDYFISSGSDIVQKNSNNPVFGVTSNPMSQSRIGLQGKESLHFLDFSGVFKLETFFNPASGELTDALKSLTQNNGRALSAQSTNIDSSVAGQAFQQSFVGISSPTFGTLTFGRQNTTLADLVAKYDPQQVSYAFSLVGLSGTPAGGGATQDRRLDDSLKYSLTYADLLHFGVQYKFQNSTAQSYATGGSGEAFSAIEVSAGAQYAGASIDAFYTKIRDAVSASALSADQVTSLPTYGLSISNTVAATISDNASYGVMGLYDLSALTGGLAPVTIYGAYQHITYMNPSIALPNGFDDIGGYVLLTNNTAYAAADKVLQVYWTGARYAVTDQFTVAIAYYGEKQNAYATGADAGCSSVVSSKCSGNFNSASIALDYHFTKRLDTYAGAMWSNVSHGLANGYLNTTMIDPTIGIRFSF